ncbi:hypothetical protein Tco_1360074 [Tanacetum coccineum]
MSSMSEDIQCAGSDTRPPMLDRTDFESWQQRIRLYCLGKDNGENIMKSINEGPFHMGTVSDVIAGGTEGAVQQGPVRARVLNDLSAEEKERYKADIRATNILLQGIPKDIYSLINHYTDAKDIWENVKMILEGSELTKDDRESQLYDEFEHFRQIKGETIQGYYVRFTKLINDMRNIKMTMPRMQLNSKFVNNMLPEWSRFITEVKLNRGLKESNFDQLYAYLKQHEVHANENRTMMERFLQPTNDPLALVSNASVQQYPTQSSKSPQSSNEPSPADNFQLDSGSSSTSINLIEQFIQSLALLTQSLTNTSSLNNNQYSNVVYARNTKLWFKSAELWAHSSRMSRTKDGLQSSDQTTSRTSATKCKPWENVLDEDVENSPENDLATSIYNLDEAGRHRYDSNIRICSSTVGHYKSKTEEVTILKKDFKQEEDKFLEEFLDIKKVKEKVEDSFYKKIRKKAETSVPKPISALTVYPPNTPVMKLVTRDTGSSYGFLDQGLFKTYEGNSFKAQELLMKKFIGKVRFGNDHFGAIIGYEDLFQIWLWHRRLNHLNFGTTIDLARQDIVRGLQRLKFEKDHLYSVLVNLDIARQVLPQTKSEKHQIWEVLLPFTWICVVPMRVHEDLGKFQAKADIGIFVGYAPNRKGYRIYNKRTRRLMETIHVTFDEMHQSIAPARMSSAPEPFVLSLGQLKSGLAPTDKELEMLFQPMFDEYLEQSQVNEPVPSATTVNNQVVPPGTSLSTTIAQVVLSTSASSLTSDMHHPVRHQGIMEETTLDDSPIPHDALHPSYPVTGEPSSAQSTSGDVSLAEPNQVTQPPDHLRRWTKDHPLDNIVGNPSC